MPLTPLRVRGKRNSAAKKKQRPTPYDRPGPSTTTAARSSRPRPRKKSLLERQLPLEILERIFLLSENIAFPRCSPLLGRLLSGRPTLVAAAVAAFAPTWHAWYGVDLARLHGFRWKTPLSADEAARCRRIEEGLVPGDPALQSDVLACPWATLPLLLEAQAQWARRFARGRPSPAPLGRGSKAEAEAEAEASSDTPAYQDVHPRARIPDALVSGPWTPDQADLLRWLRRGGARFHPAQDWELKLRGLRAAVTARDPRALDPPLVRALCLLGDFFWDRHRGPDGDGQVTDEWPRAVLADELDRLDDLRDRWRGRGAAEPRELSRLAFLMETGLGEHAAAGQRPDLERLVRR